MPLTFIFGETVSGLTAAQLKILAPVDIFGHWRSRACEGCAQVPRHRAAALRVAALALTPCSVVC